MSSFIEPFGGGSECFTFVVNAHCRPRWMYLFALGKGREKTQQMEVLIIRVHVAIESLARYMNEHYIVSNKEILHR